MQRLLMLLWCFVPMLALSQVVDIGASGAGGSRKSLEVPLDGVVRVTLPSGQTALIQFTDFGDDSAEYRWIYRRTSGAEVVAGNGRVEEKYARLPSAEPDRF